MLTVRNLHKAIDRRPVLKQVEFAVAPGLVAGLIGRNGAGKTTLLKTMAGIIDPDHGTVEYEGQSVHRHPSLKREIVFVPDNPEGWFGYTAWGCADLYAQVYPRFDMAYFKDTMRRFGLPVDRNIRHFSKGMRMMFSTALGLSTKARYVLLDEPTNGVDPIAKKQVLSLLMEAAAEGVSLVISSHLLEELERMTDTILLMKDGAVETHTSEDVAGGRVMKLQVVFAGEAPEMWLEGRHVRVLENIGRVYTLLLNTEPGSAAYEELQGMEPLLMEPLPVKLDDLYVWKLGGETDVG
ncbi:ABC transporter ATP-binding protein [Cohnella nanjingensis]|uniref:ABC transporter ATP-binding protein n=1 Tax=Cohnella nanjingensis TaxID=1387779 RepID=A0A7X0VHP7_9BACL|nr:ABC transporter ATP-binding protein [Cohnella nanjingensis]MBB6674365.1 ABC transporter ATP-binding protein [Cohnella nanjingensis]